MALLFLVIGTIFLVAAVRGPEQSKALADLLKSDFTGKNNFLVWALSIGAIAGLGAWKEIRPFSNAFLALIFIALILFRKDASGKDFLTSFITQIRSTENTQMSPLAAPNDLFVSAATNFKDIFK